MWKKLLLSLLFLIGMVFLPISSQTVYARPEYETVYTVWYDPTHVYCAIGPEHPPSVEGEWVSNCNDHWSGWGWQPDDPCAYTVISQGGSCTSPE